PQKPSQLSMFDAAAESESVVEEVESEKRTIQDTNHSYISLDTPAQRKELIEKLKIQSVFSVEVFSKEALTDNTAIIGLSFSFQGGESYFVPVTSPDVVNEFAEVLSDEKKLKVGHNLKASILALKLVDVDMPGPLFDSMLAHYLIEPEAAHDLQTLCSQYLSYNLLGDQEGTVADRVCERVDMTFQLRDKLEKEIEKRQHTKLMNEIEAPLAYVLAGMEYEGVRVDTDALARMSEDLRLESERVQKEIYELAGCQFNIGSPKQLGDVLFEQMKLGEGKLKKTKSGQYATGEDVLL